ncbi:MAG: response regulator [Gammaproteobacteria bacterium]|nr:response regulator [Gammaproteobacteria bacterium]
MKSRPVTLIVDSKEVFKIMKPMLKRMLDKPRLVHCKTHKDAMDYIDSDQFADIIFADWDLTGYPFMHSVRRDLENHNTPVIIMSDDTKIKKIVLKNIDREATFFLAKPFLEKGLVKKFNKVVNVIERRRKNRLHPASQILLEIKFNDGKQYSLPLIDISIDGCLLRAPLETSWHFSIYQQIQVSLTIEEFNMPVHGEVYRIGHDRTNPENKDTVLIMIKFSDSEQQDRELQELVDELGKRW